MSEAPPAYCPACGRHRVQGITVPRISAEVLLWECPDCGYRWHAHERGSRLWVLARPFIESSLLAPPR